MKVVLDDKTEFRLDGLRKYLLLLLGLVIFMFIFMAKVSAKSSTRLVIINDFKFADQQTLNNSQSRGDTKIDAPVADDDQDSSTSLSSDNFCRPLNLIGPLRIRPEEVPDHLNATFISVPEFVKQKMINGSYTPQECQVAAGRSIAIIIPFRDQNGVRKKQLLTMLHYMIPILTRQNNKFTFFVINQSSLASAPFNRAKLLNIGFDLASNTSAYDCFIFHDVDLILENDRAIYHCENQAALHMSGFIDKFNYKLPYGRIFGGVTAFNEQTFRAANGYSNEYWGWGAEDDDMWLRTHKTLEKLPKPVIRPDKMIYRYKMLKHRTEKSNKPLPRRFALLNNWNYRWKFDGLNSLNYEVIMTQTTDFYVNVTVDAQYHSRLPDSKLFPPPPSPHHTARHITVE